MKFRPFYFKPIILLLPFFCFSQLHHNALSAGGGTNQKVIYSIGQSSVIGNIDISEATVSQGFVNPTNLAFAVETIKTDLTVVIYPNPFVEKFSANLDKKYNDIQVTIQNLAGQLVYSQNFRDSSEVTINTPVLSIQTYLITITADNKMFKAKLIKN